MHVFNMKVEAKLSKEIKQTNMKDMTVLNTLMWQYHVNTHNNFLKNKKPSRAFKLKDLLLLYVYIMYVSGQMDQSMHIEVRGQLWWTCSLLQALYDF